MLISLGNSLMAVVLVSLVSLIGIFTLYVKDYALKKWVHVLVAVSVGALVGDVFVHIIPELFEEGISPIGISVGLFCGILMFFILEKFFHWKHEHGINEETKDTMYAHGHSHDQEERDKQVLPYGKMVLVADGMHNIIDGIIIGVGFMASVPIGIATTLAVLLHEIPQEIADYGVLIHAGYTKYKALIYNFISALMSIIGVLLVYGLGEWIEGYTGYALAASAGGFLYIASSDLVPELHKKTGIKEGIIQVVSIIIGFILMVSLLAFEH